MLKSWVSLYVNIFCVRSFIITTKLLWALQSLYVCIRVFETSVAFYIRPKEIEKFKIFQTFFGQPKSKASGCFWGRYRLQKEIVNFVHLKGKNVFKIVSFSSMLKIKKKIAFPVWKIRKICIPNAKNKRNLHSQCQKFLKMHFQCRK